jgi:hypothetical protein
MEIEMQTYGMMTRSKQLHLNDPRCYNGAYYDAEYRWGEWEQLEFRVIEESTQGETA